MQGIASLSDKPDHGRLLELGGAAPLVAAITSGQTPFVYTVRRQSGLNTLFAPYSEYTFLYFFLGVVHIQFLFL